ncbi:4Fe-4S binding protein [Microaerobacter geothermalis]|uniref:4Fe-4S dicluster domain-containing protein n=1 Tax=Microaerobacter geothermalis TaxID=674972 RepID=UPI001F33C454|nr:4Fe-4S binding protein [Microaerobacter geothermalis]MCF6094420.1 4Fe-4S binding protein [Microaerobacter geothermalis]
MMVEPRVIFNEELCKGCGLCVSVCPKGIISLSAQINGKGYHPAQVIEQEKCISCTFCAMVCPDSVISVFRPVKNRVTA